MAVTAPVNSGYTIINGTTTGSNGSKVNTWVEYKVTAQSVANNTSTIRVVLYSQATWNSGTGHVVTGKYGYVKIDSSQQDYTMSGGYNFENMKLNKFADATFTVTHGTDGKKTVTIGGAWIDLKSNGQPYSTYISGGSASASVTLPQIARASTVSSFSGTLGSPGNITITRQDNSFTHTLQYSFDNSNWTNIATNVGASCSWTPGVSLISNFSNQKTKTGYLRCITYSGSTQVGTSTSTLTLTAPSSSLANVTGNYGSAVTLTATNACGSGLTYTYQYNNGSSWVSIATGSTSKTQSWTPPTSLIANVNNSGTGTVSIRVITYVGTATVNTATGTATLTITKNTSSNREGTIGSALTIPINKAHSKLTSTITYSFGNQSNIQIVSKTTSTSYSWTPAASLLSEIPNETSGTGTIKIETFNGTQSLGYNSYTLTLSAASSVIPSASFGSPTRVNTNATVESWGIYLQGYSAVKLKLTATGNSGSTIARMSISGQGISSSSTPGTTPAYLETTSSVFSSAGTFSYIGEAKDTRGRSAARATSSNVVVQAYTSPAVSNVRIVRCNSDGTEDSAGASLKVTFSRSFTQVGQNAFTAHLQYKESGGNWQTITATELDPAESNIFNLGLHAEYNYYTRIRYSDSLSGYLYSQEITVASDARIMNVNPTGSGLAIGGFSTQADTLQVYYPARFGDTVVLTDGTPYDGTGRHLFTGGAYTSDVDELRDTGFYWVSTADGTTNIPISSGYGYLIVERTTMQSTTSPWGTCRQTFTQYNTGRTWVRSSANSQWYQWIELGRVLTFTSTQSTVKEFVKALLDYYLDSTHGAYYGSYLVQATQNTSNYGIAELRIDSQTNKYGFVRWHYYRGTTAQSNGGYTASCWTYGGSRYFYGDYLAREYSLPASSTVNMGFYNNGCQMTAIRRTTIADMYMFDYWASTIAHPIGSSNLLTITKTTNSRMFSVASTHNGTVQLLFSSDVYFYEDGD